MYRGWIRGLEANGVEVREARIDADLTVFGACDLTINGETKKAFNQEASWELAMKSLYAECYAFWPDVIVLISGFVVPGGVVANLQKRGHKVVCVFTESPYEDITQIDRCSQPDLCIVNDPTNLHRYQAFAPRTYYQSHCYDPTVHHPGKAWEQYRSDFVFVGTGYPSRVAFLEQVDWDGIDVALAGGWSHLDDDSPLTKFLATDKDDCLDNDDTVQLYRAAKMSANLYRAFGGRKDAREAEADDLADGWAMGPREVELAAVGCMFVTQPRGENREVLPMVPAFDTPGELGDLVRYYLAHDAEREQIARAAREAITDRTFKNAAARLLHTLERLPVTVPV